jgi:hypothetical protein
LLVLLMTCNQVVAQRSQPSADNSTESLQKSTQNPVSSPHSKVTPDSRGSSSTPQSASLLLNLSFHCSETCTLFADNFPTQAQNDPEP